MSAYGYTTGYGFTLVDYQTQGWHTEEYSNWRRLDGLLSAIEDQDIPFAVATGAVNTYAVDYTPNIAAYVTGLVISFSTNAANTGAATVNVDGLGAKNLFRDGAALVGAELAANDYVKAIYDGTRFLIIQPINQTVTLDDGSVTPAKLSTGHPSWDASGNESISGTSTVAGDIRTDGGLVLSHNNDALTSGEVFFSTASPSGGASGDIWFKYTP